MKYNFFLRQKFVYFLAILTNKKLFLVFARSIIKIRKRRQNTSVRLHSFQLLYHFLNQILIIYHAGIVFYFIQNFLLSYHILHSKVEKNYFFSFTLYLPDNLGSVYIVNPHSGRAITVYFKPVFVKLRLNKFSMKFFIKSIQIYFTKLFDIKMLIKNSQLLSNLTYTIWD